MVSLLRFCAGNRISGIHLGESAVLVLPYLQFLIKSFQEKRPLYYSPSWLALTPAGGSSTS
jgi:hypothetical protein